MLPHHCQEIRTSLPTPTLQSSLVPRKPAKACRGLNKGAKGESSRCRYCRRPGRVEDALYAAPALPHLVQYFPCTAPLRRKPSRVSRTISTGLWSGTHQLPQILLSLPSMAKVALFAAGAVGVALAAWPLVSWYEVRKLEKPHHTVIKTLFSKKRLWYVEPVVQLRQYSPYLVAEVTVESDNLREALRSGFKQVAGFIFGDNVSANSNGAEKVAMTSPVISEKQKASSEKVAMTSPVTAEMEGGKYLVSFVMPSKYTRETLPKPNNENVKIKEVPKRTFATYAWRGGSPSEEEVQDKKDKLGAILKQHDITVKDTASTHLWQYYPPFAPNWLRLQEVLLPIEVDGEADADEPTAENGIHASIASSQH